MQPLLEKMNIASQPHRYIVADAGDGSESNYRYLEDELPQHTGLIPYGTLLKEKRKKWKTDERKVMNWTYYDHEVYASISMLIDKKRITKVLFEISKNTKQKKLMKIK